MKISTIAIALSLTVASAQAMAQNVTFKQVDNNFETKACYVAATQGYDAVKKLVRNHSVNFTEFRTTVSCNGVSLKEFATLYAEEPVSNVDTTITIVAKDADVFTKVCLDALEMGEEKARDKYDLQGEAIFCNHRNLTQFVKKYSAENVVVRDIAED